MVTEAATTSSSCSCSGRGISRIDLERSVLDCGKHITGTIGRLIFPEHDIIIFKDLTIKIPWHYINMGLLLFFVPSFAIFFVDVFLHLLST